MGSDTDSFKLGRGSTAYNSWTGVSNNPQTDAVIILGEELPAKLFLFLLILQRGPMLVTMDSVRVDQLLYLTLTDTEEDD